MKQINNHQFTRTYGITVTYDNRFRLLSNVVKGAIANGVEKLIIVDNGCEDTCRKEIHKLKQNLKRKLIILTLPQNQGSAQGYNTGLEHAMTCSDCDFIWLLDDDNLPSNRALERLLFNYNELSAQFSMDSLALSCLRGDWVHHREIAEGIPPCRAFPRKSSFQWFHLLDLSKRLQKFLRSQKAANTQIVLKSPLEIPYAPYGGLFFHKSMISKFGYPNEQFFVYGDDTEYTYRIVKRGGKLFLVPTSIIYDAESMWHCSSKFKTLFSALLFAESDFRVYYATRNQCYFDKHFWSANYLIYTINKLVFFTLLGILTLRHNKWKRYRLIARAVRDGELGHLGRVKNLENP
jgi:GT2 family glycosyltransferase